MACVGVFRDYVRWDELNRCGTFNAGDGSQLEDRSAPMHCSLNRARRAPSCSPMSRAACFPYCSPIRAVLLLFLCPFPFPCPFPSAFSCSHPHSLQPDQQATCSEQSSACVLQLGGGGGETRPAGSALLRRRVAAGEGPARLAVGETVILLHPPLP